MFIFIKIIQILKIFAKIIKFITKAFFSYQKAQEDLSKKITEIKRMIFHKNNANHKIILASSSPIRKKILQDAGLEFVVINSDVDEEKLKKTISHLSIKDQVIFLAKQKSFYLSLKYPNALIIGSDQICELEGKIISKAKDEKDAIVQLGILSDKTHYQNNAVALYKNGELLFYDFDQATLTMKKLSKEQIESYVKKDQPIGCAGSYKFESLGKDLFEVVDGERNTILGFNIQNLLKEIFKRLIAFN